MPPIPIPTAIPIPTVDPGLVVVTTQPFWDIENWELMISVAQTTINLVQQNFYNIIIIVLVIEIVVVVISVGRKRTGDRSLAALEARMERETRDSDALAEDRETRRRQRK